MIALMKGLLRALLAFLGAGFASALAAMATSFLFMLGYRATHTIPAGANILDDYNFVTWHLLLVLPVLLIVFVIVWRALWRATRKTTPLPETTG